MCGTDDSSGRVLPKICCPSAALSANKKPESESPAANEKPRENKYFSHPGFQLMADKASCGKAQTSVRIVGGQVTANQRPEANTN